MSRWAEECTIAGVTFTGCRVELVDCEPLLDTVLGSVDFSNDASAVVQALDRGVKGVQFGFKLTSAEGTKIQDVFAAAATARPTGSSFVVTATEAIIVINVYAVPDFTLPQAKWISWSKQSEGWYEDVIFRFISKADGP